MAGLDRKGSFVRLDTEASPDAEDVFSTTRDLSGNAVVLYIAVRLPLLERVFLHRPSHPRARDDATTTLRIPGQQVFNYCVSDCGHR